MCFIPGDILCEKIKTQEETYHLDNVTIIPREIVFIVIVRRYNVVSNKIEHKYENMAETLTDLGNIFSSSEPVSFSIRVKYL